MASESVATGNRAPKPVRQNTAGSNLTSSFDSFCRWLSAEDDRNLYRLVAALFAAGMALAQLPSERGSCLPAVTPIAVIEVAR